jgi:hypothetical protein
MDNKYNGWTNYATWRVNLEMIDGMEPSDFGTGLDSYDLGQALKDHAESLIDCTTNDGLAKDYALAFLSEVNWHEIAEHMIEDYSEA